MRAFAIASLLVLSALPCAAKGRGEERPRFGWVEPEEVPFELGLAPSLELGPLPSAELPEVPEDSLLPPLEMAHEAIVPPHAAIVGRSRGAMLDRCRFRMRSVALIGHGASPDGRPEACRLLSYVRRMRIRETSLRRRTGLRIRFEKVAIRALPEGYRSFNIYFRGAAPISTLPMAPARRQRSYYGAVR